MSKKQNIYWICQVGGWAFYVAINLIFFRLSYNTNISDILIFMLWLPLGIILTQIYRYFIIRFGVLKYNVLSQIPITIFSAILMATIFFSLNVGIVKAFSNGDYEVYLIAALTKILSLTVIFIFWSLIYFGFHFFDNYKKTEIQNLKLEANTREIELNQLKSQLNPHFMFNSMNSIRALVDEDPKRAKIAITQLSNILRNTLMMHKNRFITLEEELVLVKDYLELEHVRYEERLNFDLTIDPSTLHLQIPPMMIQTLVENGIKHGVSKYPEGGSIRISATQHNQQVTICIINTGQIKRTSDHDIGFGVANTTNRLELLYGKNASFSLKNLDEKNVISEIRIKY